MLARKPTAMSLMAIASIVVGIGSGPCFAINEVRSVKDAQTRISEVRSGLRSWKIMTEKLTTDDSPLLHGDSSSPTTIEILVNYDISNDCGLDADAIFDESDNSVKEGLIAAERAVTIDILATTYGGTGTQPAGGNSQSYNPHSKSNVQDDTVNAYYSDQHPVIIDRIEDKNDNCGDAPKKCQRVYSTVSVVVTHGSSNQVSNTVQTGIGASLNNGDFFGAMPADTVPTCPEAISDDDMIHLADKGVA